MKMPTRSEATPPPTRSLISNGTSWSVPSWKRRGLSRQRFSVVPFPINMPELYRYYVPLDALFFLSIYDDWGKRKLEYFNSLGLMTHVLREVSAEQKGLSATDIRRRMVQNEPWEEL